MTFLFGGAGCVMLWTLIGYFPKRRATRAGWASPDPGYPDAGFPAPPPVEAIGSVSHCIAQGPEAPAGEGPVNAFGGYDSPAAAWRAVAPGRRPDFDLFAYRLAPVLFRDGQAEGLALPPPDLAPLPDTFERLGYDAVELRDGQCLGCSPLSCNGQTAAAAVNRYCLVGTDQEGMELARAFSVSKPEPGPYCVAEVWRDRGGAAEPAAAPDRGGRRGW